MAFALGGKNPKSTELRMLVSTRKRDLRGLPDFKEDHKNCLRNLGLRGTDVVDEFLITKVGDQDTSTKTVGEVRDIIKLETTRELEITPALELEPRCLDVDDLKSENNRWC